MTGWRPRALIVEDDPDLLVVLRVNLQAAGFDISLAADGRTALARIEAEHPDVVLLDVMLPGMDGWSVLAQLRERDDRAAVIVCSAKRNAADLERAEELGAVAYLVKPFDIDRVVEAATQAVAVRDPATSARESSPVREARPWPSLDFGLG